MSNLDGDINLIDLKGNDGAAAVAAATTIASVTASRKDHNHNDDEEKDYEDESPSVLDFSQLKLVECPMDNDDVNALPQTLEDCVGYLKELPLVRPNADQSHPETIVDMINSVLIMPPKQDVNTDVQDSGDLVVAKKKTIHGRAVGNLGHTIRPGCISLYTKFGVTYAVPEGRWWLLDINAKWLQKQFKNVSLDTDVIQTDDNQVMIIRIIEGQVGLITIQGVHYLLDVGTHVFNTGTVQFKGAVTYSDKQYFGHGPYHYLNVPRGKCAKVWVEVIKRGDNATGVGGTKSIVPRLIKEGEHFIKSTFFKYVGLANVSDEYIGHESIHILNVLKGTVAKANCDNEPKLYGEGQHIIESPNFTYEGTEDISPDNLCITHGTITIFQVTRGKVALAWNKNEPYLLDQPGLYEYNTNDFRFVKFVNANERFIELGSKKVIQVRTGEVGITYQMGNLIVLNNGRHAIDSSTHIFERFLSTKQRSIRLITYGANHKIFSKQQHQQHHASTLDDDADFLVCETKDLVKVGVRADVFYSIVDPQKCIQTLNTDELEDLVRETAVATLTNIIRSTALNQIAQSKHISATSNPNGSSDQDGVLLATNVTPVDEEETDDEHQTQQEVVATTSYFFDRAHDEFMSKLHEDFVTRYGVDIANIRMESFKIMDTELANEIAQNCLTTAHVENQLSNLQGQNLIATQKEQTSADCEKIKALAEAKSMETRANAENKRKMDAALAEAEAMKVSTITQAQAKADSILQIARAEAEAIKMKAVAEAERAKLLSQTMLGQQQCLFEIYADMVKESNHGVNKVVYMMNDPAVTNGGGGGGRSTGGGAAAIGSSPFTMGSLDGLNRDLHSLSKLGIISEQMEEEKEGKCNENE